MTSTNLRSRYSSPTKIWILSLSLFTLVTLIAGIMIGSISVPADQAMGILTHKVFGTVAGDWSSSDATIVWQVRMPRVLLGLAVGAALAISGMALQAMVRNMLADPYILGINSGASSGAAAAILFGFAAGLGEHSLQAAAFFGAGIAAIVVYGIARTGGRITSIRLLLSGVAVGYALSALTSFLIFASGSVEGTRSVMFWLLGSLSLASWGTPLLGVLLVTFITSFIMTLRGPQLDALALGDETALSLGVHPDRSRTWLLGLVSLCVGVAVAAAGSIGFVGLVIPHLARRAVGAMHTRAVPVAALMGGILLVWADIAARTLLAPQEIPIGILTAMVGAPFLLILIRRMRTSAN